MFFSVLEVGTRMTIVTAGLHTTSVYHESSLMSRPSLLSCFEADSVNKAHITLTSLLHVLTPDRLGGGGVADTEQY